MLMVARYRILRSASRASLLLSAREPPSSTRTETSHSRPTAQRDLRIPPCRTLPVCPPRPCRRANTPLTPIPGPDAPAEDDDVAAMLAGMKKKKKSKKTEDADGADGLDLTMKKKKKSKKPKDGDDEFAAKLAALDIEKDEAADAAPEPESEAVEDVGDMEEGTGIWAHDSTAVISYENLLSRFFSLLAQKNPDHASSGARSYKIPPPQCLREGNKKTIFANINEICKRMKRTDEHVTQYLFAELGTSGSVDGSRRLVIKGRFQQKQIENVLRRYISMYHHIPG